MLAVEIDGQVEVVVVEGMWDGEKNECADSDRDGGTVRPTRSRTRHSRTTTGSRTTTTTTTTTKTTIRIDWLVSVILKRAVIERRLRRMMMLMTTAITTTTPTTTTTMTAATNNRVPRAPCLFSLLLLPLSPCTRT